MNIPTDPKKLAKFYTDPDWIIIENLLLDYIKEELEVLPSDSTPPSDYKAQVLARRRTRNALLKFLSEVKIVNQPIEQVNFN
jgi:hypothetical protein